MEIVSANNKKAVSYKSQFALISFIFIGIQVAVLGLGWGAVRVINTTRAYATGESFYSKAQNAAVLSLYKYAQSGDERHFEAFRSAMKVPFGDRLAREEFEKPNPDPRIAAQGALQGRMNPADVPDVIRMFRWFRHWGPFERAIDDWREGDRLVAKLAELGLKLHELRSADLLSGAARDRAVGEIDALSSRRKR